MRAGQFVKQPGGHRAFVPAPLPPDPPLDVDFEMASLLAEAERGIGRLAGVASVLPSERLGHVFLRYEASRSCRLDGVEASLDEVFEGRLVASAPPSEAVAAVERYVDAVRFGLGRVEAHRLDVALLRALHERTVGGMATAGRLRRASRPVEPAGARADRFLPPSAPEMRRALDALERFLVDREGREALPDLLECALVHVQFDSIRPFLDGNGRLARQLVILLLAERGLLTEPLLCFSRHIETRRNEYDRRVDAVREHGAWEPWIKFFLEAMIDEAARAAASARAVVELREAHRGLVADRLRSSGHGLRLLDVLFEQPIVHVRFVERRLGCAYVTANQLVERFAELGLLEESTGWRRNRRFRYGAYLDLFPAAAGEAPLH